MQSSANKKATSMADLMASYKTAFHAFKKGDLISGTIKKLTKNEILVDVNAKSDAVVLEKDRTILNSLLTNLKVGNTVEVSVLSPESETGNPVVSLRRFAANIAWEVLTTAQKNDTPIEVTVTDVTKGGVVVVTANGISGFLPNSHMSAATGEPGKKVKVRVLDIIRKDNKAVFSQKATVSSAAFDKAAKAFTQGQTVKVKVTSITPFGMFVSLNEHVDGLIHISELAWEKVTDIAELYMVGQEVAAIIIAFDSEARRVDLSIKRLSKDPFETIAETYPVDKKVKATVLNVDDMGAYFDLGDGVEALMKKEKIPPTVSYAEGQTVEVTVSEVDKRRHRIVVIPVLREKPIGYR